MENSTIREMEQEIRNLRCDLSADVSDIGDYKVVKCMEASLQGKEMPYDVATLVAERQAVRDKINELETQIAALQEDESDKAVEG